MIFAAQKVKNLSCEELETYIKLYSSLYIKRSNLSGYKDLEAYLRNYLNTNESLRHILLFIISNFKITDNGSTYLVDINNNLILDSKDCPLTLFKLITYGNRDIKGSRILINALKYAFNQ